MHKGHYEIIIADEAELDLLEAFIWYEEQRAGLGKKFISETEKSIKKIGSNPMYNHFVEKGIRAFSMATYPYNILYFVEEYFIVKIIAVFHSSRNPTEWKLR
ncbi:type II toxin-antitoxin system RelE/ParE family toxin [Taibaiella lutea]|uniref:Type II toxin-antitoxin system RelE/ParE family toxin n=1 Tax=Taibaiella lutea TaxID=2608001 RepID=A0A5M6CT61_9BACT|nr:type II toxin-antitoxin system RelE/ParE family toxin [Taibaiella lutea]KAA5536349.1 type II toxin-antitoxin system RelE/ParE family toxin [Taibaiella lutea]